MKNISKTHQRIMYRMYEDLYQKYIQSENMYNISVYGSYASKRFDEQRVLDLDKFKSYLEDGI